MFLMILCFWCSAAAALEVRTVRLGEHPDKLRLVLELSESVEFDAFILHSPERLIIDLPEFQWRAGDIPAASGILEVRHARYQPGTSRIVFELATPRELKAAFKLPPLDNGHARLVIDLAAGALPVDVPPAKAFLPLNIPSLKKTARLLPVPKPAPPAGASSSEAPGLAAQVKPLIVIDAGHGGQDPGATSPQQYREKHIVLALAKEVKAALEASGRYRVKLTRDDDRYIKLRDRVSLSRDWGADMFISIHADSIQKSDVRGASVYTLSNKASDAQTARLAEKENRADIIAGVDLSHEDKEVANILIDLAMRDTMNQSRFFANQLVTSMRRHEVRILPNTHRYAGFAVLKAPDVPSVLIEAGFLSNRREAELLSQKTYRRQLARAIAGGVDAYFDHVGTP
ncbi:MAG: N-acetylmuramoyl-L-alanine amidase [Rhodospirillales bacterium]|nr:N-acetylmuramoyl-L-alanine amidase [Rhodospirillales bacterium]